MVIKNSYDPYLGMIFTEKTHPTQVGRIKNYYDMDVGGINNLYDTNAVRINYATW